MTIVFIENARGSGQIIKVLEDFGGYVVTHKLEPGDNRRIAMSQFKSIIVSEFTAGGEAIAFRRTMTRVATVARLRSERSIP